MAQYNRPSAQKEITNGGVGTGVLMARVISHLDPSFMGSLEVTLLKDQGNTPGDDAQTHIVRYASPFFGYTPFEFMGKNTGENSTIEGFNDTQKSYGMWMVPPDVGVNVLVLFVDGDPSQGYWFACVPGRNANHMVPAIGGSLQNQLDKADKQKYGNTKLPLPVAEINKRINGAGDQEVDPEKIKKPVHPIADRFLEQGLLEDDIRGVTTTTSRREAPSSVFGISTPGPLDRRQNAKKSFLGKLFDTTPETVPVSRLGGTTFVMDDGDARFVRKKPASEGPVQYADVLAGETGDNGIPYNEYFRVRTRTGHQLLMHNSEDIIYIGNARGTAWVEMTSNGKIDIYAADSISIHSETDLNIRADRDVNIEAGRNINMKAVSGRFRQECAQNWEVLVGQDGKITVASNYEHVVGSNTKVTTQGNMDLRTGGNNKFTAGGNTDIKTGGNHTESAARIDMNSFPAATADQAQPINPLTTHPNTTTSVSAGWDKRYQSSVLNSIMKRVPMHEPWPQHENQAPDQQRPANTDRDI
jgi:hypothetical protein